MYAVIKTGGKQYSVKVGDTIFVEKLNAEADTEVTFDQVLAVGEEGAVKVGAPLVDGASVVAKVVKNGKGKKLNILTYRPRRAAWSARVIVSPTQGGDHRDQRLRRYNNNGTQKRRRFYQNGRDSESSVWA